jgi:hypothetical protein
MNIYQGNDDSMTDSDIEELKEDVEAHNLIYASP